VWWSRHEVWRILLLSTLVGNVITILGNKDGQELCRVNWKKLFPQHFDVLETESVLQSMMSLYITRLFCHHSIHLSDHSVSSSFHSFVWSFSFIIILFIYLIIHSIPTPVNCASVRKCCLSNGWYSLLSFCIGQTSLLFSYLVCCPVSSDFNHSQESGDDADGSAVVTEVVVLRIST